VKFEGLQNYNVLIGRNNVGKSNLFRILTALVENAKNGRTTKNLIYNNSDYLKASICINFILQIDFRKKIFEVLYQEYRLKRAKIGIDDKNLEPNIWGNKDKAIKWLVDQKIYDLMEVDFYIDKEDYRITMITLRSTKFNSSQKIFNYDEESNIFNFQKLTNLDGMLSSLKDYFTNYNLDGDRELNHHSIRNLIKRNYSALIKSNHVLQIIITTFLREFFDSIVLIPDKREFDRESPILESIKYDFDFTGKNFVKYLHKLYNTDQLEWLKDFNTELRDFFPITDKIYQVVGDNDYSLLVLKEEGLNLVLELENMGRGIISIAFFLASLKLLQKNKILLIEEPELSIFPGMQKRLRERFLEFSKHNQVFITAHSNKFLYDNESISSIYMVQKEINESLVYKVPKDKINEVSEELEYDFNEIEKDIALFQSDTLLREVILRIIEKKPTESKLWDVKKTCDMWHCDVLIKAKKQMDFCEDIISFANSEGGLIIIGITDKDRNIIGLNKVEDKLQDIDRVITRWIKPKFDFYKIRDIILEKDKTKKKQPCIIIAIAQTKKPLYIRKDNGINIYKIRGQTGKKPSDSEDIEKLKKPVIYTNYRFLKRLKENITK